ncbi:MAG: transketolase [Alphaproteobacteria bacterium]
MTNATAASAAHTSSPVAHAQMANAIRALAMDAVQAANSGHPGAPMGMADLATVLFTRHMKYDAATPDWADRDRFVLSNGHASMLLYAVRWLVGTPRMTLDDVKAFRQLGSHTPGHPEHDLARGIETTTGPLGQGIANAVGMAIAERMMAAKFGDGLVDHTTWVFAGDGCLMEGISHEAASLAGHLRLGKLIVLFDDNRISIDGATSLAVSDDQLARFASYGWDVAACDGHDPEAIDAALIAAKASDRPSLIACRTVIGYGAPNKQGTAATHGAPLGKDEIAATRAALGWPHDPFVVPDDVLAAWRAAGARGAKARRAWQGRLRAAGQATADEFRRTVAGKPAPGLAAALAAHKAKLAADKPALATRAASRAALAAIAPAMPELVGGSADLTESNLTHVAGLDPVKAGSFAGRYVYFGVREHAMAAAMNGMALHGGMVPYGGTFLVFTDYCRPSIRLAALMGLRVIYVMTHDSIGLGEDGPTHQPVEHLAALRAIPGLAVFRPADALETAECWELALARSGPSVLALTRQAVPALRDDAAANRSAAGAYLLAGDATKRDATILATGSEVSLAMAARAELAKDGIDAAVVSMPSHELFAALGPRKRAAILGRAPRIAVEAAVPFGWARWGVDEEAMIAMRSFGASGPAGKVYEHFGITAAAVADAVRKRVRRRTGKGA